MNKCFITQNFYMVLEQSWSSDLLFRKWLHFISSGRVCNRARQPLDSSCFWKVRYLVNAHTVNLCTRNTLFSRILYPKRLSFELVEFEFAAVFSWCQSWNVLQWIVIGVCSWRQIEWYCMERQDGGSVRWQWVEGAHRYWGPKACWCFSCWGLAKEDRKMSKDYVGGHEGSHCIQPAWKGFSILDVESVDRFIPKQEQPDEVGAQG